MIKVGNEVEATMPAGSFYKRVQGVVTKIENGWVSIRATKVIDKWSTDWMDHPTSCTTSTKINCVVGV